MKPRLSEFESVSNLLLLDSNLRHIGFELSRSRASLFRLAREAHLALLRSMVEALRGTANFAIVGNRKKDRAIRYQIDKQPWQEIHRIDVANCKKAWRFSPPRQCAPPPTPTQHPKKTDFGDDYLVGFYDLLAMIQADCFMRRFDGAKSAQITDEQLRELEWLHENVRNEFEHYIPKAYYVGRVALISASHLALRITDWLLRRSGTVLTIGIPRGTFTHLSGIIRHLRRLDL